MTTATPTIAALEAASPACTDLRHRVLDRLGVTRPEYREALARSRATNLRLCSSCEVGSHQLCTGRLGDALWAPAFVCHCLCRLAESDPLYARYLDGDR